MLVKDIYVWVIRIKCTLLLARECSGRAVLDSTQPSNHEPMQFCMKSSSQDAGVLKTSRSTHLLIPHESWSRRCVTDLMWQGLSADGLESELSLATTRRSGTFGRALGRRSRRGDRGARDDLRCFGCGLGCELGRGANEEGIRSDGLELEVGVHFCCHCFFP